MYTFCPVCARAESAFCGRTAGSSEQNYQFLQGSRVLLSGRTQLPCETDWIILVLILTGCCMLVLPGQAIHNISITVTLDLHAG